VLDPFAGSGTTLVQSLESGFDATGADIAAFNCLLMRVKTQRYNLFVLERELRDAVARLEFAPTTSTRPSRYMREWFAPQRRASCLCSGAHRRLRTPRCFPRHPRARREVGPHARRTFDLDFPREPQLEPYWCHKHKRVPAGRERESVSAPLHARHDRAHQGVLEDARERTRGDRATGTRASSTTAVRSTAS
jgi:hypothetical protein